MKDDESSESSESSESESSVTLVPQRGIQIDGRVIADIIFKTCHCGVERSVQATDRIVEYFVQQIVATGEKLN